MENQMGSLPAGEVYDFRRYDRMWQKISPSLAAYPTTEAPTQTPLPGEVTDPCCMGSAAADMLQVIRGYISELWQTAQEYRCSARCRSGRAAAVLRRLAGEKEEQARRLQAAHYLISGEHCRPVLPLTGSERGPENLCRALRRLYHGESCDGVNFLRSAEGTADPCLQELFRDLSRQSFAAGRCLMQLLQEQLGK